MLKLYRYCSGESHFTSAFIFSYECYCLPYADDRAVTLPLACLSCSVDFVAVPGMGSGLSNSTLSKMELETEITVDWVGWLRHTQQFCRFAGTIQTCSSLVLINLSGFVPGAECSAALVITVRTGNSRWQKGYILQALARRWSVWQWAPRRLSGRLDLLKNTCLALSFHPNHSLTRYQNGLLAELGPSVPVSVPWPGCQVQFDETISVYNIYM